MAVKENVELLTVVIIVVDFVVVNHPLHICIKLNYTKHIAEGINMPRRLDGV